jgi:CRP-like cAMP-binding protein
MMWSNHFLNALSPEQLKYLEPSIERGRLERDMVLAEPHKPLRTAYFPINCIISVVAVMQDGRSVESRTVGCESGYGLLHALGSRVSFEGCTCQVGGEVYQIPISALGEAAARHPGLVKKIVQHAQATLIQAAQSTACNTLHSVDQRLCRWLLLTRERLGSDELPLTQEHLAIMLGVQRTTVTAVAQEVKADGLISYSRGRIRLRDVEGLKARSCECFEAIERLGALILEDRAD